MLTRILLAFLLCFISCWAEPYGKFSRSCERTQELVANIMAGGKVSMTAQAISGGMPQIKANNGVDFNVEAGRLQLDAPITIVRASYSHTKKKFFKNTSEHVLSYSKTVGHTSIDPGHGTVNINAQSAHLRVRADDLRNIA